MSDSKIYDYLFKPSLAGIIIYMLIVSVIGLFTVDVVFRDVVSGLQTQNITKGIFISDQGVENCRVSTFTIIFSFQYSKCVFFPWLTFASFFFAYPLAQIIPNAIQESRKKS